MTVAGLAMKGSALTWWLCWYPRHPWVNWDAFTAIFLWQFKPEWRVILPSPEDVELESEQSVKGDSSNEQSLVVDEGFNDLIHLSPSPVVRDLGVAFSKEPLIPTPTPAKTTINDDDNTAESSTHLFCPSSPKTTLAPTLPQPNPPEFHNLWERNELSLSMFTITESMVAISHVFPSPPPKPPDPNLQMETTLPPSSSSFTILKEAKPPFASPLPTEPPALDFAQDNYIVPLPPPEPPDVHHIVVVSEIPRPCKIEVLILLQIAKGLEIFHLVVNSWNLYVHCHIWSFVLRSAVAIIRFYPFPFSCVALFLSSKKISQISEAHKFFFFKHLQK
jgi:hypothetical protein